MKITELTGYKKLPLYQILQNSNNLNEFLANLKNSEYQEYLVGSGFYSGVFARPEDNYVIKIFKKDVGYQKYIEYMTKNKHNPHVPKLRGKPVKIFNKYTLIRIEKLSPISTPDQQEIFELIKKYMYGVDVIESKKILQQKFPKLIRILFELKQFGPTHLDIHSGNIMFRDTIPVITDPLVFFNDSLTGN